MAKCSECGFLVIHENGSSLCYVTEKPIDNDHNTAIACSNYVETVIDGDERLSPDEHLYILNNRKQKQCMNTSIRGMRF